MSTVSGSPPGGDARVGRPAPNCPADVMNETRPPAGWSIETAVGVTREFIATSWDSPNQVHRVCRILERFVAFAETGFGVKTPASVTPEIALRFVHASGADGSTPSVALVHLRRSALRLLFRALRRVGAEVGDPTLDLVLPPRSQLSARPLADDEVMLCRGHALWSLSDGRRSAAWALAEATCRSVEIANIRRGDVELSEQRVWIHGGRTTAPRWGLLSEWGRDRLEQRLLAISDDPATRVAYGGSGSAATGQVSACVAIVDVLTRAGLAGEPDVRPASVVAWAGRRMLAETSRIEEVARRLGMAGLDRTARFIAFDWRATE